MKKQLKAALAAMLALVMALAAIPVSALPRFEAETAKNGVSDQYTIPDDAVEYNGHMYRLFTISIESWRAAEEYCESLGGHLATLTSQEENDFVYNYIRSLDVYSAYFGLSDDFEEGNWQWVNGETSTYRNWASGEPNSESSHEDYAMFYYKYTSGKWNDGSFGSSVNDAQTFICEWDYSDNSNPNHAVCLATLECIDEGHYTGNQGDSRVYRLDKEPFVGYEPYGPTGTYGYNGTYRNGNILADTGEEVNNGLEVWLARWNGSPEISYAYRTFKLDGKYSLLRGSIGLVDSYNTTDFDVSLFIYGDGSLLSEYCLTPENVDCSEGAIYLDEVQGVNELKIEMRDNVAVAGGTSFALYDLFLYDDVGYNPDVPVGSFHGEFNYHSEITKQTESYKYYYNSAWFFRNSYDYHHPLVKMSIRTAMAGAYTTDEHIKYLYEHELGFTDYESHYPTPTEDTIGYAIARKNLIKDDNSISVIAVTVRGGGYLAEWADNFRVGMGLTANHQGFSESADKVYAGILSYINYNREKLNDEIKVWVCGYSRAAAVSNLCARKLNIQGIPNTDIEPNDVFAFCFECPNSTTDSQANNQLYSNIRCFVNPIDLVPMVPFGNPLTWGFQRYGTTYFYPSASTRWNYREYKKWMKVEYESILDSLSGGHENVMEYTKEIKNQANSMNTFTAACSTALSRENYVYFAEDRIMDLAKSILGKPNSDKNDVIEFLTRVSTAYNPVNVFEIISNIESIMYAHYPELSLAWLDSLDGVDDFKIAYSKVVVTTVKPAIPWPWNNMRTAQTYENAHPLSIEVIDAEGETVAVFSNGSFEELIDEEGIDYGICAYIDNNDQLCFDLPGDNNYSVIITSDIDAEVAVTMSTLTGELHTPEKLAAYFDVALSAGDTCTGIVENINENDEPYSLFVNGEEIEPSADLNEGDQIEHLVDVEVEGGGRVYFPGTFVTGEYAKLRVAFNEENFLGWYLDGELLSTAPEYRIMVTEDMLITAKFSTKLGDVNLDGKLSIADTILIARYALGLIELEAPCDLDGNKLISIADAIVSARYALGLMEP